jgi:hypothetical protein
MILFRTKNVYIRQDINVCAVRDVPQIHGQNIQIPEERLTETNRKLGKI